MTDEPEDPCENTEEDDYLTTISIWANSTKKRLDARKLIPDESYDHVISRLLNKLVRKHR